MLAAERGLTKDDIRQPFAPVRGADGRIVSRLITTPGYRKTLVIPDAVSGETVLCDYSSAGRSWSRETEFGAWLPVSGEYMASLHIEGG